MIGRWGAAGGNLAPGARPESRCPRRQRLERIFATALDVPIGELLVRSGWTGAGEIDASNRIDQAEIDRLRAMNENSSHAPNGSNQRSASSPRPTSPCARILPGANR